MKFHCIFAKSLKSLPLLALLFCFLIQGCSNKEEFEWIPVTSKQAMQHRPRQFSVSLATPRWEKVLCQETTGAWCVVIGEGGSIKRSEDRGKTWSAVESHTNQYLSDIHSNGERLVAVGMYGVIVRSKDGGKTWSSVSSGIKDSLDNIHGIGERLAVLSHSGSIVYSEDGGQAWSVINNDTFYFKHIRLTDKQMVSITTKGDFVSSEDGGKTWSTAVNVGTKPLFTAINGTGNILVAVSADGEIVRSKDEGKSWQVLNSNTKEPLSALHVSVDGRLVAVGNTIVYSEDGGETWSEVKGLPKLLTLNGIHGVGEHLVTVGNGEDFKDVIMRSEDGGKNWSVVYSGSKYLLKSVHGAGDWLVAVGALGDILRSDDGGKTWFDVINSHTNSKLRHIYVTGKLLLAVGDNGIILRSVDVGKTWLAVDSGSKADFKSIHGAGDRVVAVGALGDIVRSDDGGKTWSTCSDNCGKTWSAIPSGTKDTLLHVYGARNEWVALGSDGVMVRSENKGQTWSEIIFENEGAHGVKSSLNAIYCTEKQLVVVGNDGVMVRSEDGGKTWSPIATPRLIAPGWDKLTDIQGTSERLVAVGLNGVIELLTADGPRWPLLEKIGYRSLSAPNGQLFLRFELNDPDGLCLDKPNCTLKVKGRNETDFRKGQNLNLLSNQLKRNGNTWEAQINPVDFGIKPGNYLYVDVTIKGPDFSLRYPIDNTPIAIPYQVNSLPLYVALAIIGIVLLLGLLYWFSPTLRVGLYRRLGIFKASLKKWVSCWGRNLQIAREIAMNMLRILETWGGRYKEYVIGNLNVPRSKHLAVKSDFFGPSTSDQNFYYKAFISYKHETSSQFAVHLEDALKAYAKPLLSWPIRIFRDEKHLAPGVDLPKLIFDALASSEFLVLLASPEAAKSTWVHNELEYWCSELGRVNNLIIVLLSGEIASDEMTGKTIDWEHTDALPPVLQPHLMSVPLLIDLRSTANIDDAAVISDQNFINAINGITARFRNMDPNDIRGEEIFQQRRTNKLKYITITFLSISVLVVGMSAYIVNQKSVQLTKTLSQVTIEKDKAIAAEMKTAQSWSQADFFEAIRLTEQGKPREAMAYIARSLRTAPHPTAATLAASLLAKEIAIPLAVLPHSSAVKAAIFSPDGLRLATVSVDRSVRLWDLGSGLPIGKPFEHEKQVNHITFSQDSKKLVIASGSAKIIDRSSGISQIIDAATGKLIGEKMRHEDSVVYASFTPDNRFAVTVTITGTTQIFDAATAKLVDNDYRKIVGHAFSYDMRVVLDEAIDSATEFRRRLQDKSKGTFVLNDTPSQFHDLLTNEPIGDDIRDVGDITFNPAKPLAVITSKKGDVARIMNIVTGTQVGVAMPHGDSISNIVFSRDGSKLVSVLNNIDSSLHVSGIVRIWNAATGEPIGKPMVHDNFVNLTAFSPDGRLIVTAFGDTAHFWNSTTGETFGAPMQHDAKIVSVAFDPESSNLVTASEDKTARIWDISTGRLARKILRHEAAVRGAEFSPDGRLIVTVSEDGTARLWDAAEDRPIHEPLHHEGQVNDASFSPDGSKILTDIGIRVAAGESAQGQAHLWAANTGDPVAKAVTHKYGSRSVFNADGTRILTASLDGTAQIWDAVTGSPIGAPLQLKEGILQASFSPDGRLLVTASAEKDAAVKHAARLWNVSTGLPIGEPMQHDARVSSVAFSPDGHLVVTGSWDKTARLWDANTGKPVGPPMQHNSEVKHVGFSLDSSKVVTATGTDDPISSPWGLEEKLPGVGSAHIWDTTTSRSIGTPMLHENVVYHAAFSPDGHFIVTASKDKTARLWDAITGKSIGTPMRHEEEVYRAAFSPDGHLILTASADMTARLWDASNGKSTGVWMQHKSKVFDAEFSPDGRSIVTAAGDGNAMIWENNSFENSLGLSSFLEMAAGYKINALGSLEAIDPMGRTDLRDELDKIASTWSPADKKLALWFLSDPRERTLSPNQTVFAYDWVKKQITAETWDSLNNAQAIWPGHPLALAHIALLYSSDEERQVNETTVTEKTRVFNTTPGLLWANLAKKLAPNDPEVNKIANKALEKLTALSEISEIGQDKPGETMQLMH